MAGGGGAVREGDHGGSWRWITRWRGGGRNSNRQWKANLLTTGLDEYYTHDALNRLTQMQRGTLNGTKTGISGTAARELDYTLDPTGNWSAYLTKTNGTTDLNQARTSNKVNEITGVTSTPTWVSPAYDAAGNMTTLPQPATPNSSYTSVYDAWNRMVSLSAGGSTVATYKYDGRNRRIVKFTTGTSETRHFYYTDRWQDIEERTGSPAAMERQYVWGVRYLDDVICRDRTSARFYATQDSNFGVTAICDTSGVVRERYRYDPYGNLATMDASWTIISTSAFSWAVAFQGLITDPESQLIYNRHRFLLVNLGAFNRRDPIGYDSGTSLYAAYFVINGALDPFGLQPTTRPVVNPFPVDLPPNFDRSKEKTFIDKFLNSAGWGNTYYSKGVVTTDIYPLRCSNKDKDCQDAIKAFNDAADKWEQDARQWFEKNYDPSQKDDWKQKHDAIYGPNARPEITQVLDMYKKLKAAYEKCSPGQNNDGNMDGINKRIAFWQKKFDALPATKPAAAPTTQP